MIFLIYFLNLFINKVIKAIFIYNNLKIQLVLLYFSLVYEPRPTPNSYGHLAVGLGVVLGLVLLVDVVRLITFLVRRFKRPQNASPTRVSTPVQEEQQMFPKTSSTRPIRD